MRIEPDEAVATDGPFEVDDQFDGDGYLTISAGAYSGYVRLNRGQVLLLWVHLSKVVSRCVR